MIIWLSGPTGAGKSTLASALESRGWAVVREVIDPKAFAEFTNDPVANCEAFQESVMRSRASQWEMVRRTEDVLFDRSIEEDFHVFCRMHASNGLLSETALSKLAAVSTELSARVPQPDLILYLDPGAQVLEGRVALAHPAVITESLELQLSLYESWIKGRKGDVLRLNNANCTPSTMASFLERI